MLLVRAMLLVIPAAIFLSAPAGAAGEAALEPPPAAAGPDGKRLVRKVPAADTRVFDKVDAEREQLALLTQEVAYLRKMVSDAASQAAGGSRVQFRYDWLDRDLDLIQRGIQDHIDAPRQPRQVAPLKGAYRR